MSQFRVGLVGAGYIAETHAAVLRGQRCVDLAMVADPVLPKAERFAQNWNIGAAVAEAEALAKTNGFSMINLDVRSTQDRAIQSFEARGFVRYAVNDHYARVGNDYVSGYYYQKELS